MMEPTKRAPSAALEIESFAALSKDHVSDVPASSGASRLLARARPSSILAALVALHVGCSADMGEPGRERTTVRDSVGVSIVESVGEDRPLGTEPVLVRVLEYSEGGLRFVPWGVAADPGAGRVYVADQSAMVVAVFDTAGAHVGTLGRRGEGPGEFMEPAAITVDEAGVLSVLDARRGMVSRWSPAGSYIDESGLPAPYWGPGFAAAEGWLALVTSGGEEMQLDQRLQVFGDGEPETVHVVSEHLSVSDLPCGSMPLPPVLAPDLVWSSRGSVLYFAAGADYRIDVHSEGRRHSSFRRAIGPVGVTEEEARRFLELAPGPYQAMMRQCGIDAGELLAAAGHVSEVSPIVGIALDPVGRLWVGRRIGSVIPEVVDVLSPNGEYAGTFELRAVPVAFLSESLFVAVGLNPVTGGLTAGLYALGEMRTARTSMSDPPDAGRPARAPSLPGREPSERVLGPSPDNPAGLNEIRDCPECPVMVVLPPGRFTMGATSPQDAEGDPETRPAWTVRAELPPTDVEIDYPLAVGKYEVTFAEWDRCVAAGWCEYRPHDMGWGRGDRPAIFISRLDAEHYIEWLRSLTGMAYRLPSEAEWEYAARAGTRTARWWGDAVGTGHTVCDGCGSEWDDISTAPVASFPPNPWGLHDMLSNVSEWVSDCWVESHAGARTDGSFRTHESWAWQDGRCIRALVRGSSWGTYPWSVRAAKRIGGHRRPDSRSYGSGFRVVRPAEAHEVLDRAREPD